MHVEIAKASTLAVMVFDAKTGLQLDRRCNRFGFLPHARHSMTRVGITTGTMEHAASRNEDAEGSCRPISGAL